MALNFSKMNFSVSFNPTSAFPLDARSYFESYEAARVAASLAVEAGSAEGVLYFGQTIAVVENNIAQLYIIQPNGTLGEIGGKITIDTNVFEFNENGSLNLLGFADAVAGAQLIKDSNGKLSWVKPDTTTVDGLNIAVTQLQENFTKLETIIGSGESGLVADVENLKVSVSDLEDLKADIGVPADKDTNQAATGIYAILDTKANSADVLTKAETQIAINTAISSIDHLKRKIVSNLEELNTYLDSELHPDALHYVFMVPTDLSAVAMDDRYDEYIIIDIDGIRSIEKVGSWEVDLSDYVKNETLENYALNSELNTLTGTVSGLAGIVSENKTIVDNAIAAEKTRAEAAEKANADRIEEIASIATTAKETAEEALENANAAQDEIDQLTVTIDGRLLTNDDRTKLDKLVVNGDEIGISGTINASNVKELDTWITNNADTYIVNLTEKNLSNDLVTKINFITSVNTDEFTVNQGQLNLNIIEGSKINLSSNDDYSAIKVLSENHSNKIAALESFKDTINVTVENNTAKLKNLEEVLIPAINTKFESYVLHSVYNKDIAEIKDILTWKEMN